MAVFERSVSVRAPFDEVWRFHLTVEGFEAVTPDWLDLRLEGHIGPDGEPRRGELVEGSEVTLSIRPLGIGPRQYWTSRVTRRERSDERGELVDRMVDGPFPRWHHTHRFESTPGGTRMTDRVEYEFPLGPASGLSGLAWPGFTAVFNRRHLATKRQLE
jgi:ligand-binding SRPBCC domain-containing protein